MAREINWKTSGAQKSDPTILNLIYLNRNHNSSDTKAMRDLVFMRQFRALCYKNWILRKRHPIKFLVSYAMPHS